MAYQTYPPQFASVDGHPRRQFNEPAANYIRHISEAHYPHITEISIPENPITEILWNDAVTVFEETCDEIHLPPSYLRLDLQQVVAELRARLR